MGIMSSALLGNHSSKMLCQGLIPWYSSSKQQSVSVWFPKWPVGLV